MKADYKEEFKRCAEKSENMNGFGIEEVVATLKLLKNGKNAAKADMLPEFFKHMGIKGIPRLATLLISKNKNALPKQCREAKVIA